MKSRWFFIALGVAFAGLLEGTFAFSMDKQNRDGSDTAGYIEVECNIADESLYLCPESDYTKEERKTFFGLITTYRSICSGEKIFLGKTPVRPVPVPVGEYVLLVPQGYVWEGEGSVGVHIISGKKTFLILNLFCKGPGNGADDHGGSGGGSGSGSGGACGSGPGP